MRTRGLSLTFLSSLLLCLGALRPGLKAQVPSYVENNPPQDYYQAFSFSYGYTIALTLGPVASGTTEHVMSLTDAMGSDLWVLFRDANGRWYEGKQRDPANNAGARYVMQVWDPISPCTASQLCTRDTIYISFHPNGQIQMDELALLPSGTYSWRSGL